MSSSKNTRYNWRNRNQSGDSSQGYNSGQEHAQRSFIEEKDPLDIELFNGYRYPIPMKIGYLHSAADGLDKLIQASYSILGSHDIPNSLYAYYIAAVCYARLLYLERNNSRNLTIEENNFVNLIYKSNYNIPKSVGMYLAGFGNIKHPEYGEVEFKMRKPTLTPGGYFGPIKDNMYAYASYPCLGVYAQRMINEYGGKEGSWDLPDEYRYEGHPITAKCLGYSDSYRLPSKQKRFMNSVLSICESESKEIIPYFHRVMSRVSVCLKLNPDKCSEIKFVQLSNKTIGSLGQIMTVKHIDHGYEYTCPFRTFKSIEYLGSLLMYSVNKDRKQFADSRSYEKLLPVKFTGEEVPNDVNINILYESNDWGPMNVAHYHGYRAIAEMSGFVNIDTKRSIL